MSKQKSLYYIPSVSEKMLESVLGKPMPLGQDYVTGASAFDSSFKLNEKEQRRSRQHTEVADSGKSITSMSWFDSSQTAPSGVSDLPAFSGVNDPALGVDIPSLTYGDLYQKYYIDKEILKTDFVIGEQDFMNGFTDEHYAKNVQKAVLFHAYSKYLMDSHAEMSSEDQINYLSNLFGERYNPFKMDFNDPSSDLYVKPEHMQYVMKYAQERANTQILLDKVFNEKRSGADGFDKNQQVFAPATGDGTVYLVNGSPFNFKRTVMGDLNQSVSDAFGWAGVDDVGVWLNTVINGEASTKPFERIAELNKAFGTEKNLGGMIDPADPSMRLVSGFVIDPSTHSIDYKPLNVNGTIKNVSIAKDEMSQIIFNKFLEGYLDPGDASRSKTAKVAKGLTTFIVELPMMYVSGLGATKLLGMGIKTVAGSKVIGRLFPEFLTGSNVGIIPTLLGKTATDIAPKVYTKGEKFLRLLGNGAYSYTHSYATLWGMGLGKNIAAANRSDDWLETVGHHFYETGKFAAWAGMLKGIAGVSSKMAGSLMSKLPASGIGGVLRTNPKIVSTLMNIAEGFALGMTYGDANNAFESAMGNAVIPVTEDQRIVDGFIFGIFNGIMAAQHFVTPTASRNFYQDAVRSGRDIKPIMIKQSKFEEMTQRMRNGESVFDAIKNTRAAEDKYYVRTEDNKLQEIDAVALAERGEVKPVAGVELVEVTKEHKYLIETIPYQRFAAFRGAVEEATESQIKNLVKSWQKELKERGELFEEGTDERLGQDFNLLSSAAQMVALQRFSLADNALKNNSIRFSKYIISKYGKATADGTQSFFNPDGFVGDILYPYLLDVKEIGRQEAQDKHIGKNAGEALSAASAFELVLDFRKVLREEIRGAKQGIYVPEMGEDFKEIEDSYVYEMAYYSALTRTARIITDRLNKAQANRFEGEESIGGEHSTLYSESGYKVKYAVGENNFNKILEILATRGRYGVDKLAQSIIKLGLGFGNESSPLVYEIMDVIERTLPERMLSIYKDGLAKQDAAELSMYRDKLEELKRENEDGRHDQEIYEITTEMDALEYRISRDINDRNDSIERSTTGNIILESIREEILNREFEDTVYFTGQAGKSFSDLVDYIRNIEKLFSDIGDQMQVHVKADTEYAENIGSILNDIPKMKIRVKAKGRGKGKLVDSDVVSGKDFFEALASAGGENNPALDALRLFLNSPLFGVDGITIQYEDFSKTGIERAKKQIAIENEQRKRNGKAAYTEEEMIGRMAELVEGYSTDVARYDLGTKSIHLNTYLFSEEVLKNKHLNSAIRYALAGIGMSRSPMGIFRVVMHEAIHGVLESQTLSSGLLKDTAYLHEVKRMFNHTRNEALRLFPGLFDTQNVYNREKPYGALESMFREIFDISDLLATESVADYNGILIGKLAEFINRAFTTPTFAAWLQTIQHNGAFKDPAQIIIDTKIPSYKNLVSNNSLWDVLARNLYWDMGKDPHAFEKNHRNALSLITNLSNVSFSFELSAFIAPKTPGERFASPKKIKQRGYFDESNPVNSFSKELSDHERYLRDKENPVEVGKEELREEALTDPPVDVNKTVRNLSLNISEADYEEIPNESGGGAGGPDNRAISLLGPGAEKRLKELMNVNLYEGYPWHLIVMKEAGMQNGFDAIKGRLLSSIDERGNTTYRPILRFYYEDVKYPNAVAGDYDVRSSVYDNGTGVPYNVLRTSFFEIMGTTKEIDEATGQMSPSSGGFGIAKVAYLYGSNGARVYTKSNGEYSYGTYKPSKGDELSTYQVEGQREDNPGVFAKRLRQTEMEEKLLNELTFHELYSNVTESRLSEVNDRIQKVFDYYKSKAGELYRQKIETGIIQYEQDGQRRYTPNNSELLKLVYRNEDLRSFVFERTEMYQELQNPKGSFTYLSLNSPSEVTRKMFDGKSFSNRKANADNVSYYPSTHNWTEGNVMAFSPMFFEINGIRYELPIEVVKNNKVIEPRSSGGGDIYRELASPSKYYAEESPNDLNPRIEKFIFHLNHMPTLHPVEINEGEGIRQKNFYKESFRNSLSFQEDVDALVIRRDESREHADDLRHKDNFNSYKSMSDIFADKDFSHYVSKLRVKAVSLPSAFGDIEVYYTPTLKDRGNYIDPFYISIQDNDFSITYKTRIYSNGVYQFSYPIEITLPKMNLSRDEIMGRFSKIKGATLNGVAYDGLVFDINFKNSLNATSPEYPFYATRLKFKNAEIPGSRSTRADVLHSIIKTTTAKLLLSKFDFSDKNIYLEMPLPIFSDKAVEESNRKGVHTEVAPVVPFRDKKYSTYHETANYTKIYTGGVTRPRIEDILPIGLGAESSASVEASKLFDMIADKIFSQFTKNNDIENNPIITKPIQWFLQQFGTPAKALRAMHVAMEFMLLGKEQNASGNFSYPEIAYLYDGRISQSERNFRALTNFFGSKVFPESTLIDAPAAGQSFGDKKATSFSNYKIYTAFTDHKNPKKYASNEYLNNFTSFISRATEAFERSIDLLHDENLVQDHLSNYLETAVKAHYKLNFGATDDLMGYNATNMSSYGSAPGLRAYYISLFSKRFFDTEGIFFTDHRKMHDPAMYDRTYSITDKKQDPDVVLGLDVIKEIVHSSLRNSKDKNYVDRIIHDNLDAVKKDMKKLLEIEKEIEDAYEMNDRQFFEGYGFEGTPFPMKMFLIARELQKHFANEGGTFIEKIVFPTSKTSKVLGTFSDKSTAENRQARYDSEALRNAYINSLMMSIPMEHPDKEYRPRKEGGGEYALYKSHWVDSNGEHVKTNPYYYAYKYMLANLKDTMIHEVAHVSADNHNEGFVNIYTSMNLKLSQKPNINRQVEAPIQKFLLTYLDKILFVTYQNGMFSGIEVPGDRSRDIYNFEETPDGRIGKSVFFDGYLTQKQFERNANDFNPADPKSEFFYNSQSVAEWSRRRSSINSGENESKSNNVADEGRRLQDPLEREFERIRQERDATIDGQFTFSESNRGAGARNTEMGFDSPAGKEYRKSSSDAGRRHERTDNETSIGRTAESEHARQSDESNIRNISLGRLGEFSDRIERDVAKLIKEENKKIIEEIKIEETAREEIKKAEKEKSKTVSNKKDEKKKDVKQSEVNLDTAQKHIAIITGYANIDGYDIPIVSPESFRHETIKPTVRRKLNVALSRLNSQGMASLGRANQINVKDRSGETIEKDEYNGKILLPVGDKKYDILGEGTEQEIMQDAQKIKKEYIDKLEAAKVMTKEQIQKLRNSEITFTVSSITKDFSLEKSKNIYEALGYIPTGNLGYGVISTPLDRLMNSTLNTYSKRNGSPKTFLAVPIMDNTERPYTHRKTSGGANVGFSTIDLFKEFLSKGESYKDESYGDVEARFKIYKAKFNALLEENKKLVADEKAKLDKAKQKFDAEKTVEAYASYLDKFNRYTYLSKGGALASELRDIMEAEGYDRIDVIDQSGIFRGSHLIGNELPITLADDRHQSFTTFNAPDMLYDRNLSIKFAIRTRPVFMNNPRQSEIIPANDLFRFFTSEKDAFLNPIQHAFYQSRTDTFELFGAVDQPVIMKDAVNALMRGYIDKITMLAAERELDTYIDVEIMPYFTRSAYDGAMEISAPPERLKGRAVGEIKVWFRNKELLEMSEVEEPYRAATKEVSDAFNQILMHISKNSDKSELVIDFRDLQNLLGSELKHFKGEIIDSKDKDQYSPYASNEMRYGGQHHKSTGKHFFVDHEKASNGIRVPVATLGYNGTFLSTAFKNTGLGKAIFEKDFELTFENGMIAKMHFVSWNSLLSINKLLMRKLEESYSKKGKTPTLIDFYKLINDGPFHNHKSNLNNNLLSAVFAESILNTGEIVYKNRYSGDLKNLKEGYYMPTPGSTYTYEKAISKLSMLYEEVGIQLTEKEIKDTIGLKIAEILYQAIVHKDPVPVKIIDGLTKIIQFRQKELEAVNVSEFDPLMNVKYASEINADVGLAEVGMSGEYGRSADQAYRQSLLFGSPGQPQGPYTIPSASFIDFADMQSLNYGTYSRTAGKYTELYTLIKWMQKEIQRTGRFTEYYYYLRNILHERMHVMEDLKDPLVSDRDIYVKFDNDLNYSILSKYKSIEIAGDMVGEISFDRVKELAAKKMVNPQSQKIFWTTARGAVVIDKMVEGAEGIYETNQIKSLMDYGADQRYLKVSIDKYDTKLDQTIRHESPLVSRVAKWGNYLDVPINYSERSKFFKDIYDIGELEVVRRVPLVTSTILRNRQVWDSGIPARRFFGTSDGIDLLAKFKQYDLDMYARRNSPTKRTTMEWQEFYSQYKLNPAQIAFVDRIYRPALNEFIKVIREEDTNLFANIVTAANLYKYSPRTLLKRHGIVDKDPKKNIEALENDQALRDALVKDIVEARYAGWEDNVYFNSIRPVDESIYLVHSVKYQKDKSGAFVADKDGNKVKDEENFTYYETRSEFEQAKKDLEANPDWEITKAYQSKDLRKLLVYGAKTSENELMQLALSTNTALDKNTIEALIKASKRGIDIHKIHKQHIPGMKFTPKEFISQFEALVNKGVNYAIRRNSVHKMTDILQQGITDFNKTKAKSSANPELRSLYHQTEEEIRYSIAYLNQIQINEKTYIDDVRTWTIAFHLGGIKPAFWLQQALQPIQTVLTQGISDMKSKNMGVSFANAYPALAKGYAMAAIHGLISARTRGKRFYESMDGELREVMMKLDYMDKMSAKSSQELMGDYVPLDMYYGSFLEQKVIGGVKNGLSAMTRAIERFTRVTAGIAFYEIGKKAGYSGDQLVNYIADGIDRSMGEWGKGGRPAVVTSKVLGSEKERFTQAWAKAWITYKNFVFYNYSQYGHMVRHKAYAALLNKLIIGTGLHGLRTFPMVSALLWMASAFIEEEPDVELYEAIKGIDEHLDTGFVSDILNQGIGSLVGIDMSQTLGEGSPMDMLANQYGDDPLEKTLLFALGPVWSFAEGIGKGAMATWNWGIDKLSGKVITQDKLNKTSKDMMKGLPVFIKNMYRGAYELPSYGIQVNGRTIIPSSEISDWEKIMKGMSFRLSKETEAVMLTKGGKIKEYNKARKRLTELNAEIEEMDLKYAEGSVSKEDYEEKIDELTKEQAENQLKIDDIEEEIKLHYNIDIEQKEARKEERVNKNE